MDKDQVNRVIEGLQSDLKTLILETRKKYTSVKEACEEVLSKLKNSYGGSQLTHQTLRSITNPALYPLIQGCETKDPKLTKVCLGAIQRFITYDLLDEKGAKYVINVMWLLMENNIDEVKVLQTAALLLTTSNLVRGDSLSKCLVLCFRLHFAKDATIGNTAGATVRQLVSLVFERVVIEDASSNEEPPALVDSSFSGGSKEFIKLPDSPLKALKPFAQDAFSLFQDLVMLVNGDQPSWLIGMTEMTRTFGIELLENILSTFYSVFFKHQEFSSLLKERVCALVIKLFSPNVKSQYRIAIGHQQQQLQTQQPITTDKPFFPVSMRLLRLVSVLVQKYYSLLVTECEIFLSLIIKFLDPDKPAWQRALALEILHRLLAQPLLVKSFCQSYDMKPHATNIFQDTVNSLAACIQSLFVTTPPGLASSTQAALTNSTSSSSPLINTVSMGPGISPQAGFYYRGVWIPICTVFTSGQPKATFLEMLDKTDPPSIQDGYCMSVAYACLLDVIRSISLVVQNTPCGNASDSSAPSDGAPNEKTSIDDDSFSIQLVNSSWCGLLAALTLLLEASTDETSTENVLKSLQTFASVSGRVGLTTPRDAFITALCKASLPPHYTLTVLNASSPGTVTSRVAQSRQPSTESYGQHMVNTGGNANANIETEFRQHLIVAVGSPLPTPSQPAGCQQGPVVLTAKNLQCMRAILSVAHCHGAVLGSAWHMVLTTLQHLAWILGLKPSSGGSLKSSRPLMESSSATLVPSTAAVLADLPVLSSMLSRLFESSQYLDDVALHHLIDALRQLSQEALEVAYSNREPSLFAVAKLLETGLVNLNRVEVLWRPVTNHLLEVSSHPLNRMREWGIEAITTLVRSAIQYQHSTSLKENQRLQTLLISPLNELSSTSFADVRQKQVDCVLHLLHSSGDIISFGWPLFLNIIGAINNSQGENSIRSAFQCLQLVVTDYLPILPWNCLPLAVETTGKFGSQTQDLNVSLTAIGLMWNISDYFYQNREVLRSSLCEEKNKVFPDFPGVPNMAAFDKLWMCLYTKLGELCIDERPAVRKSAGQTLFSTIAAHGDLLHHNTWQAVVWQVLFPLLDNVKKLSGQASDVKVDTSGSMLIHHSRNTAQKQWAETQVLTLSGVARVFQTKRPMLQSLDEFSRAWILLLEHIENSALSKNSEVSLASLKAFQDVLSTTTKCNSSESNGSGSHDDFVWNVAWKAWLQIGTLATSPQKEERVTYIPSQPFLTALVLIFPGLFQYIKSRFGSDNLQMLCTVLQSAVSVPVHGEASPFILPSVNDPVLTPLQEGVLLCMDTLQRDFVSGNELMKSMIPALFYQLLVFAGFACQAPTYGQLKTKSISSFKGMQSAEWVTLNYVPFGEKCLTMAVHLYGKTCQEEVVNQSQVLTSIIRCLRLPLSLKYDCTSQTTWRLAVHSLLHVLRLGLPMARLRPDNQENNINVQEVMLPLWTEITLALDEFLFPKSVPLANQTPEEIQSDELLDCQVMELIRDEILPQANFYPPHFISKIMGLLSKGSIHLVPPVDSETGPKLREEFARVCFEVLLQFSLFHEEKQQQQEQTKIPSGNPSQVTNQLAITALLDRFHKVLAAFAQDAKTSGQSPMPRYRTAEIAFTLQGLSSLISALKKIPTTKVNPLTWRQLISLYPHLVELTAVDSTRIGRNLRDALCQYSDLLQPPAATASTSINGT
ncbi:protein MON2 homolog isoform X3 [Daphnia pulex]|uniref:protein MON2 homolog isoform X3 n=1 Tax=Daphnia pulex TaxID=6669 RepID=UPI001EDDB344|nr:protein MON2 homolog isoform X3 [Daphnia pulex]